MLSISNRASIENLKRSREALPWYAKLFFPSSLSKALSDYNRGYNKVALALTICNVTNKTSFIQRWFFSFFDTCLDTFFATPLVRTVDKMYSLGLLAEEGASTPFEHVAAHENPQDLDVALANLMDFTKLLTERHAQEILNTVAQHRTPIVLATVLCTLNHTNLLSGYNAQANLGTVARHENLQDLSDALHDLRSAELLDGSQDMFDAVAGHQRPRDLSAALVELNKKGLLTGDGAQANFDVVAGSGEPYDIASAFIQLNAANLLTPGNREGVSKHRDIGGITAALKAFANAGFLTRGMTQKRFNDLMTQQDPFFLARAVRTLHEERLLEVPGVEQIVDSLIPHQNPMMIAFIISNLKRVELLNARNYNAVITHENPYIIHKTLQTLVRARLLAQDVFDTVIEYSDILLNPSMMKFWEFLDSDPENLLTQSRFDGILDICRRCREGTAEDPLYLLDNYIRGANKEKYASFFQQRQISDVGTQGNQNGDLDASHSPSAVPS